jgi:hypothetical protein
VAQYVNSPLGLHCLLYLSADRVCVPQPSRLTNPVMEPLSTLERLARVPGPVTEASVKIWRWGDDRWKRVSVPCRPTIQLLRMELASKLMLAALFECRDAGRVELRLAEPETGLIWRKRTVSPYDRALLKARPGPALDGLCGQILTRLPRNRERGARTMLNDLLGNNGMFGGNYGGGWVIAKVTYELADRGYTRQTKDGAIIPDCERIQTLAEQYALAVDRWNRARAAEPLLCDALLADCTKSIEPPSGGG